MSFGIPECRGQLVQHCRQGTGVPTSTSEETGASLPHPATPKPYWFAVNLISSNITASYCPTTEHYLEAISTMSSCRCETTSALGLRFARPRKRLLQRPHKSTRRTMNPNRILGSPTLAVPPYQASRAQRPSPSSQPRFRAARACFSSFSI